MGAQRRGGNVGGEHSLALSPRLALRDGLDGGLELLVRGCVPSREGGGDIRWQVGAYISLRGAGRHGGDWLAPKAAALRTTAAWREGNGRRRW